MNNEDFKKEYLGNPHEYDGGALDLWCCYRLLTEGFDKGVTENNDGRSFLQPRSKKKSIQFASKVLNAIKQIAIEQEIDPDEFEDAKKGCERLKEDAVGVRVATSVAIGHVLTRLHEERDDLRRYRIM